MTLKQLTEALVGALADVVTALSRLTLGLEDVRRRLAALERGRR